MLQNSLPSSFLCRMPDACKDAHLFDKTVAARRFVVVVVVVVVDVVVVVVVVFVTASTSLP